MGRGFPALFSSPLKDFRMILKSRANSRVVLDLGPASQARRRARYQVSRQEQLEVERFLGGTDSPASKDSAQAYPK